MLRKIFRLVLLVSFVLLVDSAYALNLDRIKTYFLSGDYKAAILEGEKLMAQNTHSDELYYILGLSYMKDGNYLRASDIFEIILKEFKNSKLREEAELALADTYFLRGDFNRAGALYKETLKNNPDTKLKAQIFYRLSQTAVKNGDGLQAKEYAEKLKIQFPQNLEAALSRDLYPVLSSSDFYYTVQVGAFANAANARNLTEKLTQKNYPAYIEEANFQNKTSYRVRVGKFKKRQEAVNLENRLSREGYPTKICP